MPKESYVFQKESYHFAFFLIVRCIKVPTDPGKQKGGKIVREFHNLKKRKHSEGIKKITNMKGISLLKTFYHKVINTENAGNFTFKSRWEPFAFLYLDKPAFCLSLVTFKSTSIHRTSPSQKGTNSSYNVTITRTAQFIENQTLKHWNLICRIY